MVDAVGPLPDSSTVARLLDGAPVAGRPEGEALSPTQAARHPHPADGSARPHGEEAPIVLVLTVDLGGQFARCERACAAVVNRADPLSRLPVSSLVLREGEDPDAVAVHFAGQYGLPFAVVAPLAQKLREATGSSPASHAALRSGSPNTLGRNSTLPGRPGSSAGLTPGERMYRAALEAQHRREAQSAAEHQRREAEALAACQPGPVITSRARSLARGEEPAWKRLNALASSSAEHKERLAAQTRAAEQEAQLAACTFAPATTTRSSHLMADRQWAMRQAGVTAHDTLFADAQRRRDRDAELSAWMPNEATFRPAVLPSAHVPAGAPGDVVQRLHQAGQRTQQQQGAAQAAARQVDPTTGKRMFVPDTGRRPSSVGAAGPGAVHEHLYALRDELARKKQQLAEALVAEEGAHRAGASERSAALAESRRMRRFAQIFRALDTSRQGLLHPWDAATDALARLHPEIAGDVQLAASLSGDAETVDEEAFCALMEAAVRMSRTGPRGYLGASTAGRAHAQEEADSRVPFQPRINPASRRLAAASGRRPADVPVHDVLAMEQQRTQERLLQLAGEREQAQLAECTFRPSTAPPARMAAQAQAPVTLSHVARLPPVPHGGVEERHPGEREKGASYARFERDLELRLQELSLAAAAPADGQDSAPHSPF